MIDKEIQDYIDRKFEELNNNITDNIKILSLSISTCILLVIENKRFDGYKAVDIAVKCYRESKEKINKIGKNI